MFRRANYIACTSGRGVILLPDLPSHPRKVLYGRRQGHKLSPTQQARLHTLLPALRIFPPDPDDTDPADTDEAADNQTATAVTLADLFGKAYSAYCLEIGFGSGEHLAAQAKRHPGTGFLGVEPYINGVAKLLRAIESDRLDNIRIDDGDARRVLDRLPPASLDRIFVLYPDPWPKKRHNKRRIVNQHTLAKMAKLLKPGGRLLIASDIPDYIDWILRRSQHIPALHWTAQRPCHWQQPPPDWPGTRYEAKALREGRRPCYLEFIRQHDST